MAILSHDISTSPILLLALVIGPIVMVILVRRRLEQARRGRVQRLSEMLEATPSRKFRYVEIRLPDSDGREGDQAQIG